MVFALLGSAAKPFIATRPGRPSPSPSSASRTVFSSASASASKSSVSPSSSSSQQPVPLDAGYIYTEDQLSPLPQPCPDLRDLNNALEALATIFPDIQIEVFREMLLHFDGESRLALVTEALLKARTTWVKGRWRVTTRETKEGKDGKDGLDGIGGGDLPSAASLEGRLNVITPSPRVRLDETFRSSEYKKAVKALAWAEFKGLSKWTINAVLAESNYSYLDSRPTLVSISSKSWRFALSSFFLRRRNTPSVASNSSSQPNSQHQGLSQSGFKPGAETHPMVAWKPSTGGDLVPTVKSTGCAELDQELYAALVAPLRRRAAHNRLTEDRTIAMRLNEQEAEDLGLTHECAVCYGDLPFERMTACTVEGHMVCFDCVKRTLTEAVFGQGWQSSVDTERGTLRCLSANAEASNCKGYVPHELLRRALLEDRKGAEMLRKLDQRLTEHSLVHSNMTLVRCPFCEYAELDDLYYPVGTMPAPLRLRATSVPGITLFMILLLTVPFLLPATLALTFLLLLFTSRRAIGDLLRTEWCDALARHRRRKHSPKFTCSAPDCRRTSCLLCSKAWIDVHVCHESSLVALRTQVEQAMSMAVKRVCPRCSTSFVKTAGCNKLTCPCGYRMCYVCRADLSNEGYRHFCEHFRPDAAPGPCTECDKCNLWEAEDTDRVLREAKEQVERQWREVENRDLSKAERAYLETGVASGDAAAGVGGTTPVAAGTASMDVGSATTTNKNNTSETLAGGRRWSGLRAVGERACGGQIPGNLAEVCDLVIGTLFV